MNNPSTPSIQVRFSPTDNQRLAKLCGQLDEHLHLIEKHLHVEITNRGNSFLINGERRALKLAEKVLTELYDETTHEEFNRDKIQLMLQEALNHHPHHKVVDAAGKAAEDKLGIHTRFTQVRPRSTNQATYMNNIAHHDISFAIGPAGTGKTYLAVACAVDALEKGKISRILLVRPAIEAGERLGFLPGDMAQKVDPYLRPLYDALYEMLGFDRVTKLIERKVIEIAPLAFMRGRTLNDAFVILDESQNTTKEQMKMFLTRIGFSSIAVITGDITQVDLPKGTPSGLIHCIEVLKKIDGISFTFFQADDVVRHPLVQKIVRAYDDYESKS